MKRVLATLLVLLLLAPAAALALTGQSYTTFSDYYRENVTFINDNDNRHLLPLVLSQRASGDNDGRTLYELIGDVLSVTVTADSAGVVEECEIRLTAPQGLAYGTTLYNDFAISGYHSYAFLMAMDVHEDPAARYGLVTDVVEGMRSQEGSYARQLGAYTLTCSRENTTAVLSFRNNGVPLETPVPEPTETPAPGESTAPDGASPLPETEETVNPEDYIG
ncbi:MAG: hypothetical protein VB087_09140 [Candidatus Limiplasma sp.]|nr:hypothetical protein [Candidatus Limiplasma sp.]